MLQKNVRAALSSFCELRAPSVEHLLRCRGFEVEADICKALVDSFDEATKRSQSKSFVDISPRFSVAGAARVDKAEIALHNRVLASAVKMQELIEAVKSSGFTRQQLVTCLNEYFDVEAEGLEKISPGELFFQECEECIQLWQDASDEFLASISFAVRDKGQH